MYQLRMYLQKLYFTTLFFPLQKLTSSPTRSCQRRVAPTRPPTSRCPFSSWSSASPSPSCCSSSWSWCASSGRGTRSRKIPLQALQSLSDRSACRISKRNCFNNSNTCYNNIRQKCSTSLCLQPRSWRRNGPAVSTPKCQANPWAPTPACSPSTTALRKRTHPEISTKSLMPTCCQLAVPQAVTVQLRAATTTGSCEAAAVSPQTGPIRLTERWPPGLVQVLDFPANTFHTTTTRGENTSVTTTANKRHFCALKSNSMVSSQRLMIAVFVVVQNQNNRYSHSNWFTQFFAMIFCKKYFLPFLKNKQFDRIEVSFNDWIFGSK